MFYPQTAQQTHLYTNVKENTNNPLIFTTLTTIVYLPQKPVFILNYLTHESTVKAPTGHKKTQFNIHNYNRFLLPSSFI